MPKAAVDEYRNIVLWENQIRPSGEVPGMEAIAKAMGVQVAPDKQFRFRILRSDARHPFASLGFRERVHKLNLSRAAYNSRRRHC